MNLVYGILFFLLAHAAAFFQLNGQFKWARFAKHEWALALCAPPMSLFSIRGTKYTVQYMDGVLWPSRFIGFGVGIIIYAILVNLVFGEGLNTKTIISISLSLILICIQAFWK